MSNISASNVLTSRLGHFTSKCLGLLRGNPSHAQALYNVRSRQEVDSTESEIRNSYYNTFYDSTYYAPFKKLRFPA